MKALGGLGTAGLLSGCGSNTDLLSGGDEGIPTSCSSTATTTGTTS